ncbi:MAG: PQQ-dependent sugar dehydrogenase [Alphaproteobacteria bacterium]
MKFTPQALLKIGAAALVIFVVASASAVFGGLGRHSAAFPLTLSNRVADAIWRAYSTAKWRQGRVNITQSGANLHINTIYTALNGRIFEIPTADRGGEGGDVTSVRDDLLLMTHDGRFFGGTAANGFHQLDGLRPPENGFQAFFNATHVPPYNAAAENYANFRYNGLSFFDTGQVAGLLIAYTYFDGAHKCYASRLARYDFPNRNAGIDQLSVAPGNWRVLFETKPCLPLHPGSPSIYVQEAGGRMVVDIPSKTVYLTSGNYDAPNPHGNIPLPQDQGNDYGKVLAINFDTGVSRHFSIGHRNPQGITRDSQGRIWEVEHGPWGGDELNHIIDGRNYGYPYATYGAGYDHHPFPGVLHVGRHDGFEQPTMSWLPSIAPGTVLAVRGFNDNWNGDLLIGTLLTEKIVHVRLLGERIVFLEDIPIGRRVRSLRQHTDGSIVLWNGKNELIILTAAEPAVAPSPEQLASAINAPADVRTAVSAELTTCIQCHSFEPGDNNGRAPSLAEVYGSDVASTDFPNYTPSLSRVGGSWSRQRIVEFLRDPSRFAPGTAMPNLGIEDETVRGGIADALAELKRRSERESDAPPAPH